MEFKFSLITSFSDPQNMLSIYPPFLPPSLSFLLPFLYPPLPHPPTPHPFFHPSSPPPPFFLSSIGPDIPPSFPPSPYLSPHFLINHLGTKLDLGFRKPSLRMLGDIGVGVSYTFLSYSENTEPDRKGSQPGADLLTYSSFRASEGLYVTEPWQ